ncbi:hypothetical protein [Brucella sp. LJL56]
MTENETTESATRIHRGKRISWSELYRQRPDLKPGNDNQETSHAA